MEEGRGPWELTVSPGMWPPGRGGMVGSGGSPGGGGSVGWETVLEDSGMGAVLGDSACEALGFLYQVDLCFLHLWSQFLFSSWLTAPTSLVPAVLCVWPFLFSASPWPCVSALWFLLDLYPPRPRPCAFIPGLPRSGWEVAGLGVVGRLQCHVWGWHAAAGAYLLGALLWGSSLPGPSGRVPPMQCPAVSG